MRVCACVCVCVRVCAYVCVCVRVKKREKVVSVCVGMHILQACLWSVRKCFSKTFLSLSSKIRLSDITFFSHLICKNILFRAITQNHFTNTLKTTLPRDKMSGKTESVKAGKTINIVSIRISIDGPEENLGCFCKQINIFLSQ